MMQLKYVLIKFLLVKFFCNNSCKLINGWQIIWKIYISKDSVSNYKIIQSNGKLYFLFNT